MEHWKAHYRDGQYDLDCIIENMYGDDGAGQPLWMHMDSVAFWAKD